MDRERLLRGAVVKIRQSGGSSHLGTGFFVSSRSIVSCAHVTQKAKGKTLEVVSDGREPLAVGVDFESDDCEALDLAIPKLTDGAIWSEDTLPLHPECKTGNEVFALAPHPSGLTAEKLLAATQLSGDLLDNALKHLLHRDLVIQEQGRSRTSIELFRQWIAIERGRI